MTTEYETVSEKAKAEVIYNKTALTVELSKRTRFMPPPLNIIVLFLTFIVDFSNLILALISPQSLIIYIYIGFQLFQNVKITNKILNQFQN